MCWSPFLLQKSPENASSHSEGPKPDGPKSDLKLDFGALTWAKGLLKIGFYVDLSIYFQNITKNLIKKFLRLLGNLGGAGLRAPPWGSFGEATVG